MSITNDINYNVMIQKQIFIDEHLYCVQYCTSDRKESECFHFRQDGTIVSIEDMYGLLGEINPRRLEFIYNAQVPHSILLYRKNHQQLQQLPRGRTIKLDSGTVVCVANAEIKGRFSTQEVFRQRLVQLFDTACSLPVSLLAEILREELAREFFLEDSSSLAFVLVGLSDNDAYPALMLELESAMSSVEVGRNLVNEFLAQYTENICLNLWCFQEMLANAIEHGNQFDTTKKVKVSVQVRKDHVILVITDEGQGFNWRKKIREESCLLSSCERGRGIVMSNMLCTYMLYNDSGNQVTIVFTLEK